MKPVSSSGATRREFVKATASAAILASSVSAVAQSTPRSASGKTIKTDVLVCGGGVENSARLSSRRASG